MRPRGHGQEGVQRFAELADLLAALDLPDDVGDWEFKAASWSLPRDLWDSVSAFANTQGGHVALGVAERPGGGYEIAGVTDLQRVMNDFTSRVDQVFNVPLGVYVEPVPLEHEGSWILVIRVHPAPPSAKPVYDRQRGAIAGGFKRVGGSDLHLTDADVARMYQARDRRSPDAAPAETATLLDLSPASVTTYREWIRQRDPGSRVLGYDTNDLLRSSQSVTQAEVGTLLPTVAGLLLFGTDDAVQREFPAFWVGVIDIEGTEWVPDYLDRFSSYPPFRGSLITVHGEVLQRLRQDLPSAFDIDPATLSRRDDSPLLVALREALRNALIHQDYWARRPTQVRRYADRIEIENPGYSLKPMERLGEPGSDLRNPVIARAFGDMGWSEQKGSGIRAIREAMDRAGLTPPVFDSDPIENTFQVTFYRHHFMSDDDLAWLDQHTGGRGLSETQKKALVMARHSGRIDNATYCQINRTDTLTGSRELRQLRDQGYVVQSQRKGPGTHYTVPDMLPRTGGQLALPLQSAATDAGPTSKTTKEPTKKPTKKRGPEAVRDDILSACRQPLAAAELADRLHMNRHYLAKQYLGPMVREGLLERTVPGSPRARNQRYVTQALARRRQLAQQDGRP